MGRQNQNKILTVSELTKKISETFAETFGVINITGEVSDVKFSKNGHVFFVIKDNKSFINAVCFKSLIDGSRKNIVSGVSVTAVGSIITNRSSHSIKIYSVKRNHNIAQITLIQERIQRLKERGLFDAIRKKPIPSSTEINTIGVITSTSGAVLHDIVNRVKERFPKEILIYDIFVQGEESERLAIKGIEHFNSHKCKQKPDIIIIARGGGSMEDITPFNGEELAVAVSNSNIPIISAIGHETDYTILDMVSDLRASTPTAAAEIVTTPTKQDIKNFLQTTEGFYKRTYTYTIDLLQAKHATLSGAVRAINGQISIAQNSLLGKEGTIKNILISKIADNERKITIETTRISLTTSMATDTSLLLKGLYLINKRLFSVQQYVVQENNFLHQKKIHTIHKINQFINHKTVLTETIICSLDKKIVWRMLEEKTNELLTLKTRLKSVLDSVIKNNELIHIKTKQIIKAISYKETLKRGFTILKSETKYIKSAFTMDTTNSKEYSIIFYDGTRSMKITN